MVVCNGGLYDGLFCVVVVVSYDGVFVYEVLLFYDGLLLGNVGFLLSYFFGYFSVVYLGLGCVLL